MTGNQAGNDRIEEAPRGSEHGGIPCCAEGVPWTGSRGDMKRMMLACPCTGWLRRHRPAVYTAVAIVCLGFLALQLGWILGIIAFLSTL